MNRLHAIPKRDAVRSPVASIWKPTTVDPPPAPGAPTSRSKKFPLTAARIPAGRRVSRKAHVRTREGADDRVVPIPADPGLARHAASGPQGVQVVDASGRRSAGRKFCETAAFAGGTWNDDGKPIREFSAATGMTTTRLTAFQRGILATAGPVAKWHPAAQNGHAQDFPAGDRAPSTCDQTVFSSGGRGGSLGQRFGRCSAVQPCLCR